MTENISKNPKPLNVKKKRKIFQQNIDNQVNDKHATKSLF